jgi:hypothetical protein
MTLQKMKFDLFNPNVQGLDDLQLEPRSPTSSSSIIRNSKSVITSDLKPYLGIVFEPTLRQAKGTCRSAMRPIGKAATYRRAGHMGIVRWSEPYFDQPQLPSFH